MAVVDQDIIIFGDTIANNIRMWDSSIEDFEVILAVRDAQLHDETAKNAIFQILEFYHVKPKEISGKVQTFEEQLEYLCRPNGIMRRKVLLDKGWYKDASGAMLGKTKEGTYVALLPGKTGGYSFYDISGGKRLSCRH